MPSNTIVAETLYELRDLRNRMVNLSFRAAKRGIFKREDFKKFGEITRILSILIENIEKEFCI